MSTKKLKTNSRVSELIAAIEQIDSERKQLLDDRNEYIAEAVGLGYNAKIMRKAIERRRKDPEEIARGDRELADFEAEINGLTGL